MEQTEQLLPPGMPRATFVIRADPRFFWGEGRGLMPITQITEISLTWDHKSSFFNSKVVSVWGLRPPSPLDPTGGLLSPRPPGFAPPGKISWLRHWKEEEE